MSVKTNLIIDQGSDFTANVSVTSARSSLTGQCVMRKNYSSSRSNSLNVTTANGLVTLSMNSYNTGLLTPGRYVYDCVLSSNTSTIRVIEGIITVTPGVTR